MQVKIGDVGYGVVEKDNSWLRFPCTVCEVHDNDIMVSAAEPFDELIGIDKTILIPGTTFLNTMQDAVAAQYIFGQAKGICKLVSFSVPGPEYWPSENEFMVGFDDIMTEDDIAQTVEQLKRDIQKYLEKCPDNFGDLVVVPTQFMAEYPHKGVLGLKMI